MMPGYTAEPGLEWDRIEMKRPVSSSREWGTTVVAVSPKTVDRFMKI